MILTKEQIHTYRAMADAYRTHPSEDARGQGARWQDFIDTIDALTVERDALHRLVKDCRAAFEVIDLDHNQVDCAGYWVEKIEAALKREG